MGSAYINCNIIISNISVLSDSSAPCCRVQKIITHKTKHPTAWQSWVSQWNWIMLPVFTNQQETDMTMQITDYSEVFCISFYCCPFHTFLAGVLRPWFSLARLLDDSFPLSAATTGALFKFSSLSALLLRPSNERTRFERTSIIVSV